MKKLLLLSITLCLVSFTIISQTDFLEKLEKKLENYTNYQPEKIYVHTDKPFYSLDDDLWFSTYLLNGVTHLKSNKSKVVHVELINPKDSIVSKRELYFTNTVTSGDFKINKNWKPGTYTLRAYTKYMLNDEYDSFFQKEIPIYSVDNKKTTSTTLKTEVSKTGKTSKNIDHTASTPTLSFYPEGGNLIEGITNKVAFEIKDSSYSDIELSGTIKDQNGDEVLDFKTVKFSVGSFTFTPKKNKTYYASVNLNGKEKRYNLPKAIKEGYLLNIANKGDNIIINTQSTTKKGLEDTYLVVHQRGTLLYKKFQANKKKSNTIKLSTKELSDGVFHITLFDHDGRPAAERLVFVDNPKNNLKLTIQNSSKTTSSRKKVTLNLNVKDLNGQTIPSTLSMAVRDLKAYPYNNRTGNIKTWLLLNSDLRGSIKNPGYYFEKENDTRRRYLLDLVMMTHGWRRFTWTDILDNKFSDIKIKPETGLYISGTTKKLKKPYNAFSAPTRLTFFGKTVFQEPIKHSDSLGNFKFGPYVFLDSMPVIIESRLDNFDSKKRKSRKVVILVDHDKTSPEVKKNVFFNKIEKEKENLQIANFIKVTNYIKQEQFKYDQEVQRLNTITLTAKRKTELQKRREEMNNLTDYGFNMNGQRLDIQNDVTEAGTYTAFDLISQMRGVNTVGDSIYVKRYRNPAKIVLDGLEIDGSFLTSINGDEISFIDVLSGSDAATFSNAGSGVIALYSNTGNVANKSITRKPGIIDFQAKGYYTARKFYAPDPVKDFDLFDKNDLRTTLHWEPIINITQNGNHEISFYTSDLKSDYIIEIEGISNNGTPIHGIETFNVE